MKKILLILIASCFLASCDFIGKTKQIVEFTPSLSDLHKDLSKSAVIVDQKVKAHIWSDATNIANIQPHNIAVSDIDFAKFRTDKLGLKGNAPIISKVVASDKAFFVLDARGGLYAFAIENFKKLWDINIADDFLGKRYVGGGLVYSDGVLYITYGSKDLVAIDSSSGVEKWRRVIGDIVKLPPSVDEDKIYILTAANKMHAISKIDGTLMWDKPEVPEIMYHSHDFSLITSIDRVYVHYLSGVLSVFDKKSAQETWSRDLVEDFDYTPGFSPLNIEVQSILTPHSIYVSSPVGHLVKLSSKNGDILWSSNFPDIKSMNHSPSSVFITTNGREVAAIDKNNGKLQWSTKLYDEKVRKKDVVYYSVPIIINDKLHIAASNGELFVLSVKDGAREQLVKIPTGYISSIVVDGRYFLFTEKGSVFHN